MREGKVRAIGASNYTAQRLEEALQTSARLKLPRYETLQPLYNLMERPAYEEPARAAVPSRGARRHQLLRLGQWLSHRQVPQRGRCRQERARRQHRQEIPQRSRPARCSDALDSAAAQHKATPAQVALAWQMARPGLTAPIASATSLAQCEELAGAARLSLDAATLAAIDAASR